MLRLQRFAKKAEKPNHKYKVTRPRFLISHNLRTHAWGPSQKLKKFKSFKWRRFLRFNTYKLSRRVTASKFQKNFYLKFLYNYKLRIKKQFKAAYGPKIRDRQFRRIASPKNKKRSTAQDLLRLNQRLDAFVSNFFFFKNIFIAKKLIIKGCFAVNGRPVFAPGFVLRRGDLLSLSNKSFWFHLQKTKVLKQIAGLYKFYSQLFYKLSYPMFYKYKARHVHKKKTRYRYFLDFRRFYNNKKSLYPILEHKMLPLPEGKTLPRNFFRKEAIIYKIFSHPKFFFKSKGLFLNQKPLLPFKNLKLFKISECKLPYIEKLHKYNKFYAHNKFNRYKNRVSQHKIFLKYSKKEERVVEYKNYNQQKKSHKLKLNIKHLERVIRHKKLCKLKLQRDQNLYKSNLKGPNNLLSELQSQLLLRLKFKEFQNLGSSVLIRCQKSLNRLKEYRKLDRLYIKYSKVLKINKEQKLRRSKQPKLDKIIFSKGYINAIKKKRLDYNLFTKNNKKLARGLKSAVAWDSLINEIIKNKNRLSSKLNTIKKHNKEKNKIVSNITNQREQLYLSKNAGAIKFTHDFKKRDLTTKSTRNFNKKSNKPGNSYGQAITDSKLNNYSKSSKGNDNKISDKNYKVNKFDKNFKNLNLKHEGNIFDKNTKNFNSEHKGNKFDKNFKNPNLKHEGNRFDKNPKNFNSEHKGNKFDKNFNSKHKGNKFDKNFKNPNLKHKGNRFDKNPKNFNSEYKGNKFNRDPRNMKRHRPNNRRYKNRKPPKLDKDYKIHLDYYRSQKERPILRSDSYDGGLLIMAFSKKKPFTRFKNIKKKSKKSYKGLKKTILKRRKKLKKKSKKLYKKHLKQESCVYLTKRVHKRLQVRFYVHAFKRTIRAHKNILVRARYKRTGYFKKPYLKKHLKKVRNKKKLTSKRRLQNRKLYKKSFKNVNDPAVINLVKKSITSNKTYKNDTVIKQHAYIIEREPHNRYPPIIQRYNSFILKVLRLKKYKNFHYLSFKKYKQTSLMFHKYFLMKKVCFKFKNLYTRKRIRHYYKQKRNNLTVNRNTSSFFYLKLKRKYLLIQGFFTKYRNKKLKIYKKKVYFKPVQIQFRKIALGLKKKIPTYFFEINYNTLEFLILQNFDFFNTRVKRPYLDYQVMASFFKNLG